VAQINVSINGRQFRMACEDGQEDHQLRLAKDFDERVGKIRTQFGEVGDMRLTIMAALTLGDEMSEAIKRIRRLEQEVSTLQDASLVAADRAKVTEAAIASAFTSAAERIEKVSKVLTQPGGNGGA